MPYRIPVCSGILPSSMADYWDSTAQAETLQRLEARWASVTRNSHPDVSLWNESFDSLRDETIALKASGRWTVGRPDLLGIVARSRKETFHTLILGWLLDPVAPHGLGTAFLESLLDACAPDSMPNDRSELLRATVSCEVLKRHSRADIVVETPRAVIVIEAKVDAEEGLRQCDRLYEDYSGESDAEFVFLTPDGRPPQTATGDAAESFKCLSFRIVRDLLSRCLEEDKAHDVEGRATILTYLDTLRREFP